MASRRLYLLANNLDRFDAQSRERSYRRHFNPFTEYTDSELRSRYRFGRVGIEHIVDILHDEITPETHRSQSLSSLHQVLVALRFFASGSFLQVIGDTFHGYDKATVSRTVRRVSLGLTSKMDQYIKFPTSSAELNEVKQGLYDIAGFPCAIGCVDGTHVEIKAPHQNEPDFVNRKGYHSINVQGICDHRGLFTNIVARWPGSTHDSHIFKTSNIGRQLEDTGLDHGVLLGDSGYACQPFLMTPYMNPTTRQQCNFNRSHKSTRCLIERTFGVLKRRFHVLHSEIRMEADRVCTIIGACAVLHNIAILLKEPEPLDEPVGNRPAGAHDMNVRYNGPENGGAVRNHITNSYF